MPIDFDDELFPNLDDSEAYQLVMFLHNLTTRLENHYFAQVRQHCVGDAPLFLDRCLPLEEDEVLF